MPLPFSKYSYSALEVEAHAAADKLNLDREDPNLTTVVHAVEMLRKVTQKLNTLRGKVNDACIAGEIKPYLADNLLHHAD